MQDDGHWEPRGWPEKKRRDGRHLLRTLMQKTKLTLGIIGKQK
jgi:hypothetical protein